MVEIGTQVWMAENLKTTKYNDFATIPLIENNTDWTNLTAPGFCWYNNEEATYKNTYGALYNWYVGNTAKLCPSGWHLPSDGEWTTLYNYVGGSAGKLKETGTAHWQSPNSGATNETGFTALPGGYRYSVLYLGTFGEIGLGGDWWSADASTATTAWDYWMGYNYTNVSRENDNKTVGFSVRCLKN